MAKPAAVCKPDDELRHQSSDKCCVASCNGSHNFSSCPISNKEPIIGTICNIGDSSLGHVE